MIFKNIIRIEAVEMEDESTVIYNGEILTEERIKSLNLFSYVFADDSYTLLGEKPFGDVYYKNDDKSCYIIYGHTNELDEYNRHRAFTTYTETDQGFEEVLQQLENDLEKHHLSIYIKNEKSENPEKITKSSSPKRKFGCSIFFFTIFVFFVMLFIILI